MTLNIPAVAYPGGVAQWQLLWLQNVVFVFVQFTTGAALYTDDDRYAGPFLVLGGLLLRRTGRDGLITLHAACGLIVVAVNLAFVTSWYVGQPLDALALLATRPGVGWTTLLLTGAIAGMGLFGLSLYGTLRPDTPIPTPSFGYARSLKAHRGLVTLLVILLGYHLFLTPTVTPVWTGWLRSAEPFGLLALGSIAIWGVLAGQTVGMVGEWATGRLVSGRDRDGWLASGGGGGLAMLLALGETAAPATPVPLIGVVVLVAVVAGIVRWRPPR